MEAHPGSTRAGSSGPSGNGWTTDHDFIRRWVEERGGYPASVHGTGSGSDAGLLRIDYPGFSGEGRLDKIGWEKFFRKFDEANLAFVYQDETNAGKESRFSKLVDRAKLEEEKGKGRVGEA